MTPSGSSPQAEVANAHRRRRTKAVPEPPAGGGGRCLGAHPGPAQPDLAQLRQERRLAALRSERLSAAVSAAEYGSRRGGRSFAQRPSQGRAAALRAPPARGRSASRLGLLGEAVGGSRGRAADGHLARRVFWWKVELIVSRMVRTVSFSVLVSLTDPLRCQTGKLKSELLEIH